MKKRNMKAAKKRIVSAAQQAVSVLLSLVIMLPAVLAIYLLLFLAGILLGRFLRVANGGAQRQPGAECSSTPHHPRL